MPGCHLPDTGWGTNYYTVDDNLKNYIDVLIKENLKEQINQQKSIVENLTLDEFLNAYARGMNDGIEFVIGNKEVFKL